MRLLTIEEVAGVLRVSTRTVRLYCATRLPIVKTGHRRIAVLESDLAEFIRANRHERGPTVAP